MRIARKQVRLLTFFYSDNKKTLTSVSVSINDGPTKTAIVDIQAPEKDDPQHKCAHRACLCCFNHL